jgi:hypothetical protein
VRRSSSRPTTATPRPRPSPAWCLTCSDPWRALRPSVHAAWRHLRGRRRAAAGLQEPVPPTTPGYQPHPRRVGHARAQHHRRARREAARARHAAPARATGTSPRYRGCSPSRRRRSRSKAARSSRLPSMASPPCSTRRSSSRRFQRRYRCGAGPPTCFASAKTTVPARSTEDLVPFPAAERAS